MDNMGKSIIIATTIFSASYLFANLHTTRTTSEGTAHVVNNVTGGAKVLTFREVKSCG